MRKLKVNVIHPAQQHSHQWAQALSEAGMLGKYWSGVPIRLKSGRLTPSALPSSLSKRAKHVHIHSDEFSFVPWTLPALMIGRVFPRFAFKTDWNQRVFHEFGDWVSKVAVSNKPDVIVAFENSALSVFRLAKKLGIFCILDAPSLHPKYREKFININRSKFHEKISENRQQEIILADKIITCSDFARSTYLNEGVSLDKVQTLWLGANQSAINTCGIVDGAKKSEFSRDGIVFCFAGALTERKSIDLIIKAFAEVQVDFPGSKLNLVGGCNDVKIMKQISLNEGIKYWGQLPQNNLFDVMRSSDCLLLPSRYDGFGMVVVEGLACGIPAIVSTRTGAKDIIQKAGDVGWVVEPNADALRDAMIVATTEISRNRNVYSLRCKQIAGSLTWDRYRESVRHLIQDLRL